MFATNLVLLLALIAMIAGAVWLFRDGEGTGPKAPIQLYDNDKDKDGEREGAQQVRVRSDDAQGPDESGRG
ncbi:hypothetical protein F2Q65_13275 [Thiohalocapsa marina]|uniref:Uncharacterized protein n=1 Tax=Thiohalocapsa marina TaxID=424902 RepID=A0A5M8FHF4_9GAMM|nr:hypothetical protein [Thiohalocapsa marina]KAA6184157.1 hypothetical protein F2Q65_13275 [Thiohalocapsa marina]